MAKSSKRRAPGRTSGRRKNLPDDIAIVHGPTEDGHGARLTRLRRGELSIGEIRPMAEGKPIDSGEIVRLSPIEEGSRVCEVEVVHAAQVPADSRDDERRSHGPARIATEAYRHNWTAIFGNSRARTHDLPN